MKKTFVLLLLVVLVSFSFAPALSESTTITIIAPFDDIEGGELEKPIVVEDLLTFTVDNWEFIKKIPVWSEKTNGWEYYEMGSEGTLFLVHCSMLNETLVKMTYSKHLLEAKLIFRDKYEYPEPLYLEYSPDEEYWFQQYQDTVKPFDPLINCNLKIVFKVPALIETSKDPLVLHLTINNVEYAFKVR